MSHRLRLKPIAALAAGALLAASASAVAAADQSVSIVDFDFEPSSVEVNVGDTVTWTNDGEAPHNVHFTGGPASDILDTGGTYSRTFEDAGTFDYICDVHPQMMAKVVVEGAAPTDAPTAAPTDAASDDAGESPAGGATQPPTDAHTSNDAGSGGLSGAALLLLLGALGLLGLGAARRATVRG